MKKHLLACAALSFALVFLFSGCSLRFTALPNLLRPPKLTGVYEELQEAFESAVEKNFLLKTPLTGEYRSSFILYDVDNDDEEEAFVFYTLGKDQSIVHVHFMDSQDGKWTVHKDILGVGNEVYSVSFSDLNHDGRPELLVGWNLFDSKESKVLTIYNYSSSEDGPSINTLAREAFTAMLSIDLDHDGNTEIFLLAPQTTGEVNGAVGKLLKMTGSSISVVSTIPLDPKTVSYVSMKSENLGPQVPVKIYIDASVGTSGMMTEIVTWDSGAQQLVAPLHEGKKGFSSFSTRRYEQIASRDINNDAIIEVPVQLPLPDSGYANTGLTSSSIEIGSSDNGLQTLTATAENLYMTKWVQFQGTGPEPSRVAAYSSINYSDGYLFFYPDEWVKDEKAPRITIISNQKDRRWTFFARENGKTGDELFTIWTVPAEQWKKSPNADYTLLKENDSVVYVARLSSAASTYGIDIDQLKSSISVIE